MHVLFVCTGNTCRSPMAEGYFKSLCKKSGNHRIKVSSAGTFAGEGLPASESSVRLMKQHGIDISKHSSSRLDADKIRKADLIVTMTGSHRLQVGAIDSSALKKTRNLMEFVERPDDGISDPIGGDISAYGSCFDEMKQALDNLFLDLTTKKFK